MRFKWVFSAGHGGGRQIRDLTVELPLKLGTLDLAGCRLRRGASWRRERPHARFLVSEHVFGGLGLAARYDEALEVSTGHFWRRCASSALISLARMRFCSASLACAGLRRWTQAEKFVTEAIRLAGSAAMRMRTKSVALRMRVLAQQASFSRGPESIEYFLYGHHFRRPEQKSCFSRALVLASAGRTAEARSLLDEVRGLSQAVEPTVLAPAVEAICSLSAAQP